MYCGIGDDNLMDQKVILYIAMSADGFIARTDGDISWLDSVKDEKQDYGYSSFMQKIDTVVMGRRTYEQVLKMTSESPHKDKKCYVVSSTLQGEIDNLEFYNGDPARLVRELLRKPGGDIYIDGGAELIKSLKSEGIIDQYVISIIPVFLGNGMRLFQEVEREDELELIGTRMYENGFIQLRYRLKSRRK